ncbi:hypothetical protein AA102526_2480 [Asaia lannensis NBRC 102526]|nr:hypothetical protein AA102526_2480 [Asaia lannensis NBRC 102526]
MKRSGLIRPIDHFTRYRLMMALLTDNKPVGICDAICVPSPGRHDREGTCRARKITL